MEAILRKRRPAGGVAGGRAARARGGQRDGEARAAAGGVLGVHAAVVGVDDRGDDRQAEPGAGLAALAAALGAPEALEERACGSSPGSPGPWSRTSSTASSPAARTVDLDRRPRGRVDERVAQQVGEHLAQLVRVAADVRRAARRAR